MSEESKRISLKCSVCGNINFEYDDEKYSSIEEASELKCTVCNKVYTQEELINVNQNFIEREAKELADDAVKKLLKKSGFKIK